MKLGLLIEAAQTHQRLAEAAIDKLNGHTQGLKAAVRDEIRRTIVDAMKSVQSESQRAVEGLQKVKGAANVRVTLWTLGLSAISASVALFVAWWIRPTPAEIATLRTERDELAGNIEELAQLGARADVRRCGTGHLRVRVDLQASRYGESADYLV